MALPTSWPSDYDYAEAHGNYDTPEREPSPDDAPLGETGREILSPAEMAAELRRILERAGCGTCERDDEQMGAALAARMETTR